jgi:hypothetical protein
MKRSLVVLLSVLFVLSLLLNLKLFLDIRTQPWHVSFGNANTRDTYETVHHVRAAQQLSTGRGIKVGVLDKYFGFSKHDTLYADGKDFVDDREAFEEIDEHGYWLATTLKEIAPGVKVYALNVRCGNKGKEAQAIEDAMNWAIDNRLDILTYSAEPFDPACRPKIDSAVKKAIDHHIVTTFIHYPLPENILPHGFYASSSEEGCTRSPDVNIYHYDYNTLFLVNYEKFLSSGRKPRSGDDLPYFSLSSMSPVLAGFVAMLMEIKRDLPPEAYKQILITSSREVQYHGTTIPHVVDAQKAVEYLKNAPQNLSYAH